MDTPMLELKHPKLRSLLSYWHAKRGDRDVPTRTAIDPLEMSEWLGNVLLIDVTPDGEFRYRLYGTGFVVEFGKEMTGRSIEDLPPDQQKLIRDEYRAACATGLPSARTYTAEFDIATLIRRPSDGTKIATWERLVLPMSRAGDAIDMLMVGAYDLAEVED